MSERIYEPDEWTFIEDPSTINDPNSTIMDPSYRLYVDNNNVPITGILKNYFYFKEDDPRNNVYVENGKRL